MDLRDRSVEVWRRGIDGSERVVERLTWRPSGLASEVVIDLDEVFRDVGGYDDYGT